MLPVIDKALPNLAHCPTDKEDVSVAAPRIDATLSNAVAALIDVADPRTAGPDTDRARTSRHAMDPPTNRLDAVHADPLADRVLPAAKLRFTETPPPTRTSYPTDNEPLRAISPYAIGWLTDVMNAVPMKLHDPAITEFPRIDIVLASRTGPPIDVELLTTHDDCTDNRPPIYASDATLNELPSVAPA